MKKRTARSAAIASKKMHDTGKKTIVIKRCTNEAEAEIIKGLLVAARIKASISKDDIGGMYPSLQSAGGGIYIRVPQKDADKATKIIRRSQRLASRARTHVLLKKPRPAPSSAVWPLFLLGSIVILLLGLQVQLTLIYIGVLLGVAGIALEFFARSTKKKESKQSKPRITAAKRNYFIIGLAIGLILASGILFYNVRKSIPKDGVHEYDRNGDGKVDTCYTYKNGSIVKVAYDRNFDGAPDIWAEYKNGLLALEKDDNDFNGKPDVTYYFEKGVVSIAEFFLNEAPIITKKQIFRDGVLREEWVDKDLDGKFDERIIFDFEQNPINKIPFPTKR
ncbi:MAG: DUF2007 domain-containing protein [Deltaproteobacteria bacterium]|nr:DUF2007 domain-containing protein [Deltaproteobacteria bacterium]